MSITLDQFRRARKQAPSTVPGPPGNLVTGHLLEAWDDPLSLMMSGMRSHGDLVRFGFGPVTYLLANDPEDVRRVLLTETDNYKKSENYDSLRLILGNGLITSEGPLWQRQRKMAQPGFHPRRIASFVEPMERAAKDLVDRLRDGQALDVHQEMMRLTFRIVGLTLVSKDLEQAAQSFGESLTYVLEYGSDYSEAVVRIPTWVPTRRNRLFHQHKATLDQLVHDLIKERRASETDHDDLLGMLMSARDDQGQPMPDELLRDEVMTMIVAGHETTAVTLSFALHLLAKNPAVRHDVLREIDRVAPNGVGDAELPKLELVERVIRESLRLYPPAWMIERQATRPDVLSGHTIREGDLVGVCPFTLHRHPGIWESPEAFDPDRFLKARVAQRPRYSYLPFGAGPRVCIGGAFAIMEAKIVLATLLRSFRFESHESAPIALDAGVTLRPKSGIPMVAYARKPRVSTSARAVA